MEELKRTLEHYYYKPAHAFFRTIELRVILDTSETFQSPVLDLGCGDGIFMSLITAGPVAAGIDLSSDAIAKARRRAIHEDLRVGSATALPFADASFATVFSNCVIEHIPQIDDVISEVSRVLRPGGTFLFTVPSHYFDEYLFFSQLYRKLGLRKRADRYPIKLDKRIKQIHKQTPLWWEEKLASSGLKVRSSHYYVPKPALGVWNILSLNPVRVLSLARFAPGPVKKLLVAVEEALLYKLVRAWARPLDDYGAALLVLATKEG